MTSHPHIPLNTAEECTAVFTTGISPTGQRCLILEARTAYTPQKKALSNGAAQSGHNGGGAKEGETALECAKREVSDECGIAFHADDLIYHGRYEQLQPAKWAYTHVFTVEVKELFWSALTESAGRIAVTRDDIVHRVARGNVRLATLGLVASVRELAEFLPSTEEAHQQLLDVLANAEQGFSTQNVAGLLEIYNFRSLKAA